ncbi:MAG: leucine-rich repeat protein [Oscillospiraceae bacterium]|nr:leucine-rich repeat protein [Oscillospiraceae bacterium]
MKTIQIPMNSNPFTVVINNKEYSYTAGQTIEVPDEVAGAIEDALELEPKPQKHLSRIAQLAEGSLAELTAVDLEGISTLSNCAFYGCIGLKKVTIPNGVKTITNNAFGYCWQLGSVYLPETPPTLLNANAFDGVNPACVFYCKTQKSKEVYLAAENWSTLAGTYTFVVEA